jgi:RNA polymerase sigma factor (sigma-70 family)
MARTIGRSSRHTDVGALRKPFLPPLSADTEETRQLWRRYVRDDADRDALDQLTAHYAPLTYYAAIRLATRGGIFADEVFDDLVSDGCLGLLHAIRRTKFPPVTPEWAGTFRRLARRCIVNTITREVVNRQPFTGGYSRTLRATVISEQRRSFVQQNGRMPDDVELSAQITSLITNPNFYTSHSRKHVLQIFRGIKRDPSMLRQPRVRAVSQLEDPAQRRSILDQAAPADADADGQAIVNKEAMRLAMRDLRGIDRTLFRMAIDGDDTKTIAAATGLNVRQVYDRVNGLFWQARCRADLADYLGVRPAEQPQQARNSRDLVSIRSAGPAAIAV